MKVSHIMLLTLLASSMACEDIYNTMKGDVQLVNMGSWMNKVEKGRNNNNIYIIHFYKNNDGKSYDFSGKFKEKATELKGIVHFVYVNCDNDKKLCDKEAPKVLPALKVYPPRPMPAVDLELDLPKAIGLAVSHVKSFVKEITEETVAGFVSSDVSLPKVFLFTDKTSIPLIFRALSNAFVNKLQFAIVRSDQKELQSTYGVKKFPTVLVIKKDQKKPIFYTKEINYNNLFEFLNVFSEQFATTDSSKTEETKPWLFESIPELTNKSAKEVCYNLDKTLCVVVFSNGKPEKETFELLKDLKKASETKAESFVHFKFVWVDSSKHAKWNSEFQVDPKAGLQVRILNPGRRKRFLIVEEEFSRKAIEKAIERITGGDARFINIRADLPAFSEEL